jgi:acetylornithine deacetylase/succinyl-diaminopimelate desuccinylase-like protein
VTVSRILRSRESELAELARALVAAPSPNPPGDERAVVRVLEAYLARLSDVRVRIHGPSPRRPTLVAALGTGERTLALAAHTDTHPIADGWTVDPAGELRGDRLYGRGSTDNKGAVAAMAVVFRVLAEHGAMTPRTRLLLIANADEETGGREGVEALCEQWDESPDAIVVAEPSGVFEPWETLWVDARGTSRFALSTRGVDTHSSLAGRDGARSAIEDLELLVSELRDRIALRPCARPDVRVDDRLTLVSMHGGQGYGRVPADATAECELRVGPGLEQASVEQAVEQAFEEACSAHAIAHARLEYATGSLRWMAPSACPPDSWAVTCATLAWKATFGVTPTLGCFPGGTDARLFAADGTPTVIAGPGALVRAHHADEYVTLDELSDAARLYAEIVQSFQTERTGDAQLP